MRPNGSVSRPSSSKLRSASNTSGAASSISSNSTRQKGCRGGGGALTDTWVSKPLQHFIHRQQEVISQRYSRQTGLLYERINHSASAHRARCRRLPSGASLAQLAQEVGCRARKYDVGLE